MKGEYEMEFVTLYPHHQPMLTEKRYDQTRTHITTEKRYDQTKPLAHPYGPVYALLLNYKRQYEKWVATGAGFVNVDNIRRVNEMLEMLKKRAEEEKKKWRAFLVGLKKRNSIQFYAARERKHRRRVANGWKRCSPEIARAIKLVTQRPGKPVILPISFTDSLPDWLTKK